MHCAWLASGCTNGAPAAPHGSPARQTAGLASATAAVAIQDLPALRTGPRGVERVPKAPAIPAAREGGAADARPPDLRGEAARSRPAAEMSGFHSGFAP